MENRKGGCSDGDDKIVLTRRSPMKRTPGLLASTAAWVILVAFSVGSSAAQALPISSNFSLPFDDGPKAYGSSLVNAYGYIDAPFRTAFVMGDNTSEGQRFKNNWTPETVIVFKSAMYLRLMGAQRYALEPATAPGAPTARR
jgi:hypothetical protein